MDKELNENIEDLELKKITLNQLKEIDPEKLNLKNKKYSISDLEYIIKYAPISIKSILQTQKLTPSFCIQYILSTNDYCISDSDSYITVGDIILYQKHITRDELIF